MKIYNGYKRLNENYSMLTDEYEYAMANTYLMSKKENQEAVFDVFFSVAAIVTVHSLPTGPSFGLIVKAFGFPL